jgi:uncharacterized protein (TIGR00369 family)
MALSEHPFDRLSTTGRHIVRTLGYRTVGERDGRLVLEWDAEEDFTFPTGRGVVVHGGMIATLLDSAMGHATVLTLEEGETFLTADLHVEFYRSGQIGTLRGEGWIVHRSRRLAFCAAELFQGDELLASARCTQIIRSAS